MAKDKVRMICLVLVKIYGNKPRKLLNKIKKNKEHKIDDPPEGNILIIKSLNSL